MAVGEYNDGSVRDLTKVVRFSSNIAAIAAVNAGGTVTAESQGETAIMARTLGRAAAVPIIVVKIAHSGTIQRFRNTTSLTSLSLPN